jgi:hypothetical protein
MDFHPKKKMTGNCSIARNAWYNVSVIFFQVIAPSPNKTNKFIPYIRKVVSSGPARAHRVTPKTLK